jgi:hypothetical protein
MIVFDRVTGRPLSPNEILLEVNRDRSDEWQDYTLEDLRASPEDLADWIDPTYYEVSL